MADKVVVKSVGVRERTDKSGKIVKYSGNVYLHYLTTCLREYDQTLSFHAITVPSRTLKYLLRGSRETLLAKGLQVEPEESDHLQSLRLTVVHPSIKVIFFCIVLLVSRTCG